MRYQPAFFALGLGITSLVSPALGFPWRRFGIDAIGFASPTLSSSFSSITAISSSFSSSHYSDSTSSSTHDSSTSGAIPGAPMNSPASPVDPGAAPDIPAPPQSNESPIPPDGSLSTEPPVSSVVAKPNAPPASSDGSSTPPAASGPSTPPDSSSSGDFIRGVNIGGWLVLEKWMVEEVFAGSNAVDQWTFDSTSGAQEKLQQHWDTFFTESDVKLMKDKGINAIRIPVGFWAYDNSNTPYLKGADAYLEKAIGWAQAAGLKVWIDCHGSPGSQNGFDNSGRAGGVQWQQGDNLQRSTDVLVTMAKKYGSMQYADTVIGLELVNEPISWGGNNFETTKKWAADAYKAVTSVTANPNLMIVMHDAFQGAGSWTDLPATLNSGRRLGIDSHLYQCFIDADSKLTQPEHIQKACGWSSDLSKANAVLPTFVAEWSPVTNICVNPDGSTTPGISCSVDGCQCQGSDFRGWNDKMVEQVRRYVEAQLDVFETSTSGYFMWSFKGPGAWGFLNGIEKGTIPNPVTSRRYPKQC